MFLQDIPNANNYSHKMEHECQGLGYADMKTVLLMGHPNNLILVKNIFINTKGSTRF